MEELKQLEQLQHTLSFIKSRGLTSSNEKSDDVSSNRFLANFILLLIKPCGDLKFDDKLNLINDFLPKVSTPLLEEFSVELCEEDCPKPCAENSFLSKFDTGVQCDWVHCRDVAMVGFDAMQRANSTLEDFCRSYFMFHGVDVNKPQVIFKHLPVLSFTESYIYQLDRWNENILEIPPNGVNATDYEVEGFNCDPFRPLATILESHGLLTDRIKEEFRQGEEYWALERKLCFSSKKKKKVLVEDVMRAIHLKSFDYRVLNLILYQLRGEKVNELHMQFLSISEFLVEVSDDLFDYEDDVLENNFNVLRMFVHVYGASTAPAVLAKYITEAEEQYQRLLKILDPQLAQDYQKRCKEATREGGKKSGNPLGTWNIPSTIADEDLYRLQFNPT